MNLRYIIIYEMLNKVQCENIMLKNISTTDSTFTERDLEKHLREKDLDRAALQEFTVPSGITRIGLFVFSQCSSLATIKLPDSLAEIDCKAFDGCTSLTTIELPSGMTKIGDQAFRNCTSLKSIVLPDGMTEIASQAFEGCTSLTSIELPSGMTKIGFNAFCDCTSLSSIKLPDSLTKVSCEAFANCSALTAVEFPNGLTKIEPWAFRNCTSLTSIELPPSLTEIGNKAFGRCTSLSSIKFAEGLCVIKSQAFHDCSSLTFIDLPNSLTVIGFDAFHNCTALTSIMLPITLSKDEWVRRNRSELDKLTEDQALNDNERIRDLNDAFKKYLENYVKTFFETQVFRGCNKVQYIVTNQNFDWKRIGVDTSKVQILSYLQYLEQRKPSLFYETGIHNLEPDEVILTHKMINDQDYLPTWDTLKDTFQNKSTTQLRSLHRNLGKDIRAVDDVIPSIGMTINNSPLHDSIFSYMSIKDCDEIFDGSKNLNFIWQTEIKDPKDDLSEVESEQNTVESEKSW